jgi:hypothetical protein
VALRFVADTLRLNPDGSGAQVVVVRRTTPSEPDQPEVEEREVSRLHYAVSGDRIEISFVCPDPPGALMSCVAPPHYTGTLTAAGVRFDHALAYRTPLVFERISE